jgi:hypothetical protein
MRGRNRSATLVLALPAVAVIAALAGCGGERDAPWIDARLFFGLSSDHGDITAAQFTAFTDATITPAFPDGLTAYHADGQWRDDHGTVIREPSMVVELLCHDSADARAKIHAIIDRYKQQFHQEAVLLVVDRPDVEFR